MALDPFTSAGSAFIGYGAKKDAFKQQKNLYQQSLSLLGTFRDQQSADLSKSEGLLKGNIGTIGAGYDAAIKNLAGGNRAARQDIRYAGKQNLANVNQSLASRGLGNTTVLDNANRGVYSDMGRELARADEQFSQLLASLQIGKAQGVAGASSSLANFYPQASQLKGNTLVEFLNLLRDKPQKPSLWVELANAKAANDTAVEQLIPSVLSAVYGGGAGA